MGQSCGTGVDALNGFAADVSGNVFVGGFFLSPTLTFDATTLTILGVGYNVFFARLGNVATGSNELYGNNTFGIYPNPSTGKFTVESAIRQQQMSLEIYNAIGEKVMQQQNSNVVDLSKSPKGIYFVKISDGIQVYTDKIIVQ